MNRTLTLSLVILCAGIANAQRGNPFAPPQASMHYAPDRTCDLLNIDIEMDVDYPARTFRGTTINTMSPLRSGITEVKLMAGKTLEIGLVSVDGKPATYRREERNLIINTGLLTKGKPINISISYSATNSKARPFGGGGGGWHWIEPTATLPNKVGFWTQGEAETNSEWAPTWDYPNDLATSRSRCTVQADWDMIGNGSLIKTTLSPDQKRKTFEWKMTQPHATYLLTMVGGPFDIKKDKWQGVDLWYVVPKGSGDLIDNSFGHTKDMLTFFSDKLGVKYPWTKYAQNAMYDFGGGMENVSATTLGMGALTEARDGYFEMDGLNSHELAHQWFGDLVTCKDWSDTWLNESFATVMQFFYFEHSLGSAAYDWEVEGAMRSYFAESRRYKRPISTKMYSNGDAMFDSHAYPKGGTILHSLRRMLGDEGFFGSLNTYLTKWRHTPVESAQLRRAVTETTGIDAEKFWAQWIEKPGHPVLEYTYAQDGSELKLTVKQLQDTSDGTPVYDIDAKVGLITADGKVTLVPVRLSKKEDSFVIKAPANFKALIFDPAHDFLREIPTLNWAEGELASILRYGLNAADRAEAMRRLLTKPTDENIAMIRDAIESDTAQGVTFRNISTFANLAKPELRSFWLKQLDHVNYDRSATAVLALAKLPVDPATTQKLRSLINDKAPIQVVVNTIGALATWDKAGNADVFKLAQKITDKRGRIKSAADRALTP
ncbi:MAG: aminopeptidase [Armatimonadetes bacterium]|nr:aminopeptidase [Armatimonadota bacterium]